VALSGCGGDDVTFTDPGARFEVDPGDDFTVTLESNATTGFAWQLETALPENVVRLVRDVYVEPDTDLVGAAGRQELTFEGVGDGSTFIQLWYIRSFDDPPEPADRAQFEVIVGTGDSDESVDPGDVDEPISSIPDVEDAISVSELLATSPSGEIVVRGSLFDDGTGLRLCDALAESFPPQCPGDAVIISNPGMIQADFTVEAGVRWTDRVVVLPGELIDGEFRVLG
jgi:inhibitor of cysteine peptidase